MIDINFRKDNKTFNLKAIICPNTDILKFANIEYFKGVCHNSCPSYNTNWSCPPNSPRFDDFIKDYKYSLIVQMTGETNREEFLDTYNINRILIEDLLSNIQNNFECLKTAAGKCYLCEQCSFLYNKSCRNPEGMRYSMESMGVNLLAMSEELFGHKIDWVNDDSNPMMCTSIGSIVYNDDIEEDDFYCLIDKELSYYR